MTITPTRILALLEAELVAINDPRVVSHIRSLLVAPMAISRGWDYGTPGQSYPCWSILNHARSNTGIAYCEFGFGPRFPWGLVFLSDKSIGMDAGWYGSFMEAYFASKSASDLPIWRVFKQEGESYPGFAITEESDWDSTWKEVLRLRSVDPKSRYDCSHSIRIRTNET